MLKKKKKRCQLSKHISNQGPFSNSNRPRAHLPQLLNLSVTCASHSRTSLRRGLTACEALEPTRWMRPGPAPDTSPGDPAQCGAPRAGFRRMSRSFLSGEASQATGNNSANERHCARACYAWGAREKQLRTPRAHASSTHTPPFRLWRSSVPPHHVSPYGFLSIDLFSKVYFDLI